MNKKLPGRKQIIGGLLFFFLTLFSNNVISQVTDSCLFRTNVVKKLTNITLVPNVEVSPGPGRFYGYVEYKPANYDPSKKYGLIMFFHGMSGDRKSTRLNSSHVKIAYAVFCLKKKKYKLSDKRLN